MSNKYLINKYNVPGPRYTSYPTVPYWDQNTFSVQNWRQDLADADLSEGVSVYIHLPFCESLCTYCGCTTRITKNHSVEEPYIESLMKEWALYIQAMEQVPEIKEIHFGGGTPTFFSAKNLKNLIEELTIFNRRTPQISVEAHPNYTSEEQLRTLYDLGTRRLSFGIQDFDPDVQKLINRIQPFETVENITNLAREIGYESINFDLIYGLPGQTEETVADTINRTLTLMPDRIAFYSYAHVPWMKPAQKSFEEHLPDAELKRKLYELGKEMLEENDYLEIGMDHFALKKDELALAFNDGSLHRNFMGYTTQMTRHAIGLGVSAIGDIWTGFAQNVKKVEKYHEMVNAGEFPVERGHILNSDDLIIRQHILDVMCRFETEIKDAALKEELSQRLIEMERDQLVTWKDNKLFVTEAGIPFVRNVCMAFDQRMIAKKPTTALFSQTV